MPSITKENYLKALYHLADEAGRVQLSDLSKLLEVSNPTANNMVKKMESKGWVEYERYKPVVLTDEGRKAAALIIRKHRITEMFLVEKMGFGWEEVHDVAEQMEHIDSPLLFDRMNELLSFPQVDPHGSPIPDKDGEIKEADHFPLSEVPSGKKVVLRALSESSNDFLKYLNNKSIALGTVIKIEDRESFDGSVKVSYDDIQEEHLSSTVAERLLVEMVG
jgi:DtxR family Mn-dependent transcriptional regulator